MHFSNLGLRPELLKAITSSGYKTPTPIQRKAIPAILENPDVLAGAQTGTGKTAAFAFPILQILRKRDRNDPRPRALILSPTRELASQVNESFKQYGRYTTLRTQVVFGGVGARPQIDRMRRGIDILVACPGRLLDLAGTGSADLSGIEILVLDEADRMLDMGFIHDIRRILKLVPSDRQSLLFSATYSKEVRKLAGTVLRNPINIEVTPTNSTVECISQVVHHISQSGKAGLLVSLVQKNKWSRTLVFTRTKHGANRLSQKLEKAGVSSAAIHGNKSQNARTRALEDFKEDRTRVLVATDIAARGLDIESLENVVNFELPNVALDYVHRIGRTGRAGATGHATSLVSEGELPMLEAIESVLGRRIPVQAV